MQVLTTAPFPLPHRCPISYSRRPRPSARWARCPTMPRRRSRSRRRCVPSCPICAREVRRFTRDFLLTNPPRAKLPDLRTGGTESDLDVAVDIEHASAHHGALPFPLPTGTESDLDVAVEIATALVALGEVRSSDPKLEAALTYLEETHSLALKKEDAKAEAPS